LRRSPEHHSWFFKSCNIESLKLTSRQQDVKDLAALDTKTGTRAWKISGSPHQAGFVDFLADVVAQRWPKQEIRVILVNLSAHKT